MLWPKSLSMRYLSPMNKSKRYSNFQSALVLFLFLTCLLLPLSSKAQEKNYCDDPEAKAEWQALIKKYPGSEEVNVLHALRVGLCKKIDRRQISVQDATKIFESARQAIVRRIERREKAREEAGGAVT